MAKKWLHLHFKVLACSPTSPPGKQNPSVLRMASPPSPTRWSVLGCCRSKHHHPKSSRPLGADHYCQLAALRKAEKGIKIQHLSCSSANLTSTFGRQTVAQMKCLILAGRSGWICRNTLHYSFLCWECTGLDWCRKLSWNMSVQKCFSTSVHRSTTWGVCLGG